MRRVVVIVAWPEFEQIAEYEQLASARRGCFKKLREEGNFLRADRTQMQIRNEQRAHSAREGSGLSADALDDDELVRYIRHTALHSCTDALNRVHRIHPVGDLAKHTITPALH